jgi:hypothetical protein
VSLAFLLSFFTHTSRQTRLDFKNNLHTHTSKKKIYARKRDNNNGEEEETLRRAEKEEENGGTVGDG